MYCTHYFDPQCYKIVEDYEEKIENWYFHDQDQDLTDYLCRNTVLKKKDQGIYSHRSD